MAIRRKVSISERRACRLVGLSRSVLHYEAQTAPGNEILKARLVELAHERRRFGYRRLHVLLEREGLHANHKRVHRLYREAGLAVRRRRRRHGVMVERERPALPAAPNEVWSIDFVMDALSNGRRLKCLTIVDDFTKEAVDIVVDHGISGLYGRRSRKGVLVPQLWSCKLASATIARGTRRALAEASQKLGPHPIRYHEEKSAAALVQRG
ncbi:hypothetical protein RPSD_21920 [Ralstonia solanacearum]|nr:hypothetical protein RPSD_21920 [Ralstonia solanacearum]